MQPAVAINRLGGLLWRVVVACHHKEAAAAQFATFTNWHDVTGGRMDHLDIHMRQGKTYRRRFPFKGVCWQCLRNDTGRLGLAEDDNDIGPHTLFDLLHEGDRDWGGATGHYLQRGGPVRLKLGMLEQSKQHRGDGEAHVAALLVHDVQHFQRVESDQWVEDHFCDDDGNHTTCTCNVEEWHG